MNEGENKFNPEQQKAEYFAVGDMVEFDSSIQNKVNVSPGDSLGVEDLIVKYGQGPFKVRSARDSFGGQMLMLELSDGRLMPTSSQWLKKTSN